jgi:hypothetical protein
MFWKLVNSFKMMTIFFSEESDDNVAIAEEP